MLRNSQNLNAKTTGKFLDMSEIAQFVKDGRILMAKKELFKIVRKKFPELEARRVEIRASKLGLNSVSGTIFGASKNYFFKFHTEENEVAAMGYNEYYAAEELYRAGLPMIRPRCASTKAGSQIVIYDFIEAKTAYQLWGDIEDRIVDNGSDLTTLLSAERELAKAQLKVALRSLKSADAGFFDEAPINQLFYNRLVGRNGVQPRVENFYFNKKIKLPRLKNSVSSEFLIFEKLAKKRWKINGTVYRESFYELIEAARKLLGPDGVGSNAKVLAHGDDHNGNKFLIDGKFYLFDAAVGGWQPALLAFVKATFHNVWAHPFWLYEPERLKEKLQLEVRIDEKIIEIQHNWSWERVGALRQKIVEIYLEEIWRPMLKALEARKLLTNEWQEYLRKAFFCCPFLVTNLCDEEKFTPEASFLALSRCIELGSSAKNGGGLLKYFFSLI